MGEWERSILANTYVFFKSNLSKRRNSKLCKLEKCEQKSYMLLFMWIVKYYLKIKRRDSLWNYTNFWRKKNQFCVIIKNKHSNLELSVYSMNFIQLQMVIFQDTALRKLFRLTILQNYPLTWKFQFFVCNFTHKRLKKI